jgi:hypothetical protein
MKLNIMPKLVLIIKANHVVAPYRIDMLKSKKPNNVLITPIIKKRLNVLLLKFSYRFLYFCHNILFCNPTMMRDKSGIFVSNSN